jgi:hypothetical protein
MTQLGVSQHVRKLEELLLVTPSNILEPSWGQLIELGFTVLPSHAVGAFKESEKVKIHRLTNKVSETIYIGIHTNKFTPNRVNTVISEAENSLRNI